MPKSTPKPKKVIDTGPIQLDDNELREKIRQLERQMGLEPEIVPGTGEELWPGGPSIDTNDIRVV